MKKTLRLLVTDECPRSCEGCCNKDYDLPNLPITKRFDYKEIIITGGEPLKFPGKLFELIKGLRLVTDAKIYVYTANMSSFTNVAHLISITDGITVTLHDKNDSELFTRFNEFARKVKFLSNMPDKSLRLNVFKGISYKNTDSLWKVKDNIEWIENCPLPDNEEFKRLHILWKD